MREMEEKREEEGRNMTVEAEAKVFLLLRTRSRILRFEREVQSNTLTLCIFEHRPHHMFLVARNVSRSLSDFFVAAMFLVWLLRWKRIRMEAGLRLMCGQVHHCLMTPRVTPVLFRHSLRRYEWQSFQSQRLLQHCLRLHRFIVRQ